MTVPLMRFVVSLFNARFSRFVTALGDLLSLEVLVAAGRALEGKRPPGDTRPRTR
jgi:hypothetical protein